jgi:pilus assembly protein CpaF
MVLRYTGDPASVLTISPEVAAEVAEAVVAHINAEFSPGQILAPDGQTVEAISERIRYWTGAELRARGLGGVDFRLEAELATRIQHQLLGLGFLEPLLGRRDISEIMINQDGGVWLMLRGMHNAVRAEEAIPGFTRPSVSEVRIVVDKMLGAVGRRISEAEPIVAAKIPRSPKVPAGARVNVVAPPIANGPYPAINIRFYEEKPVRPEQILAWGEMNQAMMEMLRDAIQRQLRIMIAGGTATGKTTLLSCLAGLIPPEHRILLVEDPAEIFLDHPHVVSLEARPATVDGRYGVSMGDLVTTAMRMSPKWLLLGEVRHGKAAVWLLRAQMSDHPGMSTIHADEPRDAVKTLCLLAAIDHDPPLQEKATRTLISRAVDVFIQIGIDRYGVRRVTRIVQVEPELQGGDVWMNDVWVFRPEQSTKDEPVWEQVGELTRQRVV